jgi:hypothetical protein
MLSKTWQNIVIFPAILPANLNWIISDFFESSIYGRDFTARVQGMGIEQFRTSPRSPWQNCFVELIIGSIRRECLNHVIIINEGQLRRILKGYFRYYHETRTHLSLEKDVPTARKIQPRMLGRIVQIPEVGGLHHRYERRAA